MQPLDPDQPGNSTGPVTPEGKARSSLNSVRHDCCAKTVIVKGESEADFNQFRDGWLDHYQPESDPALSLVLEAASGTGHIGPCRKFVPRPKKRGGCECATCVHFF